ncbi:NUBPL iron-transfer p-loop NTPase domain-containing protein [Ditylenchus destructor]|nr:NUBPL iron-transfer p-loop NTPase domain-containing protein [Ditylenchus destructor]
MDNPVASTSSGASSVPSSSSKVIVNRKRQDGNPVIKYIRNVPYEWSTDIKTDFECSQNCGVLYLSLKYHKLHPGYIETRFGDGKQYQMKVLLVLVNVDDCRTLLRDLNMFCYRAGWILILCYTVEEAAEYLENLKISEKRSPEQLINSYQNYKLQKEQQVSGRKVPTDKEKNQQLYDQAVKFLSSIRSISQSDAKRLLGTFGSIQGISKANKEQLEMCPGLGPIKAVNVNSHKMSDVPTNANESCPGTGSENAGKTSSCAGCPNQRACATGEKSVDPDITLINDRLKNVKHKILVLSGKGGVGKSTVTTNLAFALAANPNSHVGVLDIDICGPSQARMFGCEEESVHDSGEGWSPIYVRDNLAVMSIAFLLESRNEAVIWRGPRKNALIKQFLRDVDWSSIDFLLIDTPPGTSDEHISVVQLLLQAGCLSGAIIVTTPQEMSLLDVRKEINFCQKTKVPILGVVENMSFFACPCCSTQTQLFPSTTGGAAGMCKELSLELLAQLPHDPNLAASGDQGAEYFEKYKDSPVSAAFSKLAQVVTEKCKELDDQN